MLLLMARWIDCGLRVNPGPVVPTEPQKDETAGTGRSEEMTLRDVAVV